MAGLNERINDLIDSYMLLASLMTDPDSDPEAIKEAQEECRGDLNDTMDALSYAVSIRKSNIDAIDDEIKRLQNRKKSMESETDWYKDRMLTLLKTADKTKVKTALHTVSIGHSVRVQVNDEDALPKECLTYKAPVPNKTAIKILLEDGIDLHGAAELVESENIRIK